MQVNPDFRDSSFDFFRQLLPAQVGKPRLAGFSVGQAGPLDFLLSRLPNSPRISLSRQIRRGDRYFTARAGHRIVAIARICYVDTPEIRLDAGEASLISFYTAPDYRGRGLYVALIQAMLHHLHCQGFKAAYIWAERSNHASIRGIEKTGFTRVHAGPTSD